jgi:DNA-binding transcriptional LysR family regulator
MDLNKVINELYAERNRLTETISALEKLLDAQTLERRGRKSMGTEERRQVSMRMKRYWAERRKGQAPRGKISLG